MRTKKMLTSVHDLITTFSYKNSKFFRNNRFKIYIFSNEEKNFSDEYIVDPIYNYHQKTLYRKYDIQTYLKNNNQPTHINQITFNTLSGLVLKNQESFQEIEQVPFKKIYKPTDFFIIKDYQNNNIIECGRIGNYVQLSLHNIIVDTILKHQLDYLTNVEKKIIVKSKSPKSNGFSTFGYINILKFKLQQKQNKKINIHLHYEFKKNQQSERIKIIYLENNYTIKKYKTHCFWIEFPTIFKKKFYSSSEWDII